MIHYKREYRPVRIGLNITVGTSKRWWPYFTFIWAWYSPTLYKMRTWRIRLRTHRPKVFYEVGEWDVIESFLKKYDQRLITRELIEDLRLHAYLNRDVTLASLLNRYRLPESF